MAVKDVSIR
jgi:hypothetical protein